MRRRASADRLSTTTIAWPSEVSSSSLRWGIAFQRASPCRALPFSVLIRKAFLFSICFPSKALLLSALSLAKRSLSVSFSVQSNASQCPPVLCLSLSLCHTVFVSLLCLSLSLPISLHVSADGHAQAENLRAQQIISSSLLVSPLLLCSSSHLPSLLLAPLLLSFSLPPFIFLFFAHTCVAGRPGRCSSQPPAIPP